MFTYDENKFFCGDNLHEPDCEVVPHCPPHAHFNPSPRFTLPEEMRRTAERMNELVSRLIKFEERIKCEVDTMTTATTKDNVVFKTTMREAWANFVNEVKNEVNSFESNIDNIINLYQVTSTDSYEKFVEEVGETIDTKTEAQNVRIEEAEHYMKENIGAGVSAFLADLKARGQLEGVLDSSIVVTPELFGAVGDGVADDTPAIVEMFASGKKNFVFTNTYKVTSEIEIPENVVITSNNAKFVRETFDGGIFKTSGNNITLSGHFNFEQTAEKYKLDHEGVNYSAFVLNGTASNISIDSFSIKNFIGGVVFGGSSHNNITINKVYVENCDFGVWGANCHGVNIKVLAFKYIDCSQLEPAHALYLTGNDPVIKSTNVHIGHVYGESHVTGSMQDAVLSVKATSGFTCDCVNVKNVQVVFTALNSSGRIKNIHAENVTAYAFMVQGSCADGNPFNVEDSVFYDLNCSWYAYSVGDSASARVERCKFVGNATNAFMYLSAVESFTEKDCEYEYTGTGKIRCYNVACANVAKIQNPTIKGMGLVSFTQSGVNVVFEINPANLCAECNNVTYHTHFLDNEHFAEVTDIANNNLYNNIIAVNAVIIKLRGNGVFTIINKDNASSIVDNGTGAIVLKDGKTQYTSDEWNIKMFRVINNVAYEI